MSIASALYISDVVHARFSPVRYRFRYRVFHLLLDIDEMDTLDARLRLFSHNGRNLFSFRDRDHGPRDGSPLRPWIENTLAEHGIDLEGGRVRLLCFPRVLGHAFNPLSVWYCHDANGRLVAVLCEVRNTFGEYHNYLLTPSPSGVLDGLTRLRKSKQFHVSPFLGMNAEYEFRVPPPAMRLGVHINEYTDGEKVLYAGVNGGRRQLTDFALMGRFLRMPLMTLRVVFGIHWQALKLWLRGVPFHRKPEPPHTETT